MKLIPVLMIVTGVVLIYSAKKDDDPRNVIFEALGLKRRVDYTPAGAAVGKALEDLAESVKPGDYKANPPGTVTVSV